MVCTRSACCSTKEDTSATTITPQDTTLLAENNTTVIHTPLYVCVTSLNLCVLIIKEYGKEEKQ